MLKRIKAIYDYRSRPPPNPDLDAIDIGDLSNIRVLSRDERRLIKAENLYKDVKQDVIDEKFNLNFNLPPRTTPTPRISQRELSNMNFAKTFADFQLQQTRENARQAAETERLRYETMRQNHEAALEQQSKKAFDVVGANYGLTLLDSIQKVPNEILMTEIAPYLQPKSANTDLYFNKGALNYPTNVPAYNSNMSMYFPAGTVANLGFS